MSVVDITAPAQGDTIALQLDLDHPPEKVWRALTDPTLLTEWLLPSVGFAPAPGAPFKLTAPPQPGWDGTVDCRFVEIEPHQKLSYTWRAGDIGTVVTFTVAPTPSGTRLTVVQSGFKSDQKRNFGGARYGWRLMSGRLVELLTRVP